MSQSSQILNFGATHIGTTWKGGEVQFFNVDGDENETPLDLTEANIRCQLYYENTENLAIEFSLAKGNLEIKEEATEGTIIFKPIERVLLKEGRLIGDLEITDSENVRLIYIEKIIWLIKKTYTK